MIQISEELKTRFKQDSVPKDIIIRVQDDVIEPITKKNTLSQQVTLTESICEEEQLTFGGCNVSQFEFTAINMNADIKGYEISPYLLVDGIELPLGVFIVNNIEKIAGKTHRKITAYDRMQLFDRDVREWYASLTFPITIKNFRDSLCAYVGIEQNEAVLLVDNIAIGKTLDDSQEINGLQLMTSICEISGCFGRMDRCGKFDYLFLEASTLFPDENLYPSEDLYPSDASDSENYLQIENRLIKEFPVVDDYYTDYIDGIWMIDNEGAYYTTPSSQNPYRIEDNFIIYGMTQDEMKAISEELLKVINAVSYRPIKSLKIVGQPYLECGDMITAEVNGYGIESYVFKRTMTGVYSLDDCYESQGKEVLEYDSNGIINAIKNLNRASEVTRVKVEKTNLGLEAEISRATKAEGELLTKVDATAEGISAEVSRATKEEGRLASSIELTDSKIVLKVDKNGRIKSVALKDGADDKGVEFKVDVDNIELTASDVINLLTNGDLNLTGKNIKITSTNFNVDKDGNMNAKNGTFSGKITSNDAEITGGNIKLTAEEGTISKIIIDCGDKKFELMPAGFNGHNKSGVSTMMMSSSGNGYFRLGNVDSGGNMITMSGETGDINASGAIQSNGRNLATYYYSTNIYEGFNVNGYAKFTADGGSAQIRSKSSQVNIVDIDNVAYANISASGFTNMSSKLVKENVSDITKEQAEQLLQLRPVNFDYIEGFGKKGEQGLIAEEVLKVIPHVVDIPDGYEESSFDRTKGINQPIVNIDYTKLIPSMIALIQYQDERIKQLEEQIGGNS